MRIVAVILARGGSKGIPNKNLKRVGERSLVARAVQASRAAGFETFVSSDSESILKEASASGATGIHRPEEFASDEASSESALLHALSQDGFEDVGLVAFIQPTSPFISDNDLREAANLILSGKAGTVFSARENHSFAWEESDASWEPVGHSRLSRPRRQDLTPSVIETGAFYLFSKSGFELAGSRFSGSVSPLLVDSRFSMEIDSPQDLELARTLDALWSESGHAHPPDTQRDNFDQIKAVAYDFDGVMTDNYVSLNELGQESVRLSRSDGYGIKLLKNIGITQAIISLEVNAVVKKRATKLGIDAFSGVEDKKLVIESWAKSIDVPLSQICFVGNDLNDIHGMRSVGISVAVSDALSEVKMVADVVLASRGGHGAIRELADLILKDKEKQT
jgi:N-acylneuraminate cytidylyltransferase